jgi:hypothetical protein
VPLNPSDPVVEAAVFGQEVENFLNTRIGAYLLRKAQDQASEAIEELAVVDAEDPKAIRKLQNKISVSDQFIGWLREAIMMGEQATDALREES